MRCPVCGGEIVVSFLYQYSHDYKVLKNGKLSKRYKKNDCGPMEDAIVSCTNCLKNWGPDEVIVSEDGLFFLSEED